MTLFYANIILAHIFIIVVRNQNSPTRGGKNTLKVLIRIRLCCAYSNERTFNDYQNQWC